MGYYIVQGGSTLKQMTTAGALTSLTLPDGVVINSAKRMRSAVLGGLVVLVNSPSINLTVDRFGTVRPLAPNPPSSAPVLSAQSGGTLTGTYTAWVTFIIKDDFGNLVAESDFSAAATNQAVSSQWLRAVVPVSESTIKGLGRRVYRSTTGPGTTKFPWVDLEDNIQTTVQDDVSDAGLSLIAAPTDLGAPPQFELIVEWKNRLWGKSLEKPDTLFQSANGKPYAYPSTRTIIIPPEKFDARGITGFLRRKDELGVGKAGSFHKIRGTSESNFQRTTESDSIGIWAPDSCVVAHDVGYFLGNPAGVYTWHAGGLTNISNPKVKAWFETDTYFNRSEFDNAVGMYDPTMHAYVLFLASAGQTTLDRWVAYDIASQTWWGPHKTGAFTIAAGGTMLRNGSDVAIPVWMAADGKLYTSQATKTDGSSTAVDFDVKTNWLSGDSPGIQKLFLQPEVHTEIQAGGTLSVIPRVGKLSASEGTTLSHTMTTGHERLARLGQGELCQLRFRENTAGQAVTIHGVEVPFHEIGRRP